jgi:hypothetical protein
MEGAGDVQEVVQECLSLQRNVLFSRYCTGDSSAVRALTECRCGTMSINDVMAWLIGTSISTLGTLLQGALSLPSAE